MQRKSLSSFQGQSPCCSLRNHQLLFHVLIILFILFHLLSSLSLFIYVVLPLINQYLYLSPSFSFSNSHFLSSSLHPSLSTYLSILFYSFPLSLLSLLLYFSLSLYRLFYSFPLSFPSFFLPFTSPTSEFKSYYSYYLFPFLTSNLVSHIIFSPSPSFKCNFSYCPFPFLTSCYFYQRRSTSPIYPAMHYYHQQIESGLHRC